MGHNWKSSLFILQHEGSHRFLPNPRKLRDVPQTWTISKGNFIKRNHWFFRGDSLVFEGVEFSELKELLGQIPLLIAGRQKSCPKLTSWWFQPVWNILLVKMGVFINMFKSTTYLNIEPQKNIGSSYFHPQNCPPRSPPLSAQGIYKHLGKVLPGLLGWYFSPSSTDGKTSSFSTPGLN